MNQINKPIVAKFLANEPSEPMTATRAILVFGKNSATYKFALLKTLCEFEPKSEISYDDIGPTFLRHLVTHHEKCPHQFNRRGTALATSMDNYLVGSIDWTKLYDVAEKNIFNNVFDATHNVGGGSILPSARLFEHVKADRKIILTDNLNTILDNEAKKRSLSLEAEKRWQVVEEGWRTGLSPWLISNNKDDEPSYLLDDQSENARSSVPLLHTYQKGLCFYCNKPTDLNSSDTQSHDFPDAEHFIPKKKFRSEVKAMFAADLFGIWNLVVACMECNRGPSGAKWEQIPTPFYQEKLLARNRAAILEHGHLLKKAIQWSLGIFSEHQLITKHRRIFNHFANWSQWSPRRIYGRNWYDDS